MRSLNLTKLATYIGVNWRFTKEHLQSTVPLLVASCLGVSGSNYPGLTVHVFDILPIQFISVLV